MADDVQAARRGNRGEELSRQQRVDDADPRAQVAVRDPVFTPSRGKSRIATDVASLPVPAVVGTATTGRSGPGSRLALPDRTVDPVEQLASVGDDERCDLGGVDRRPAADADEAVEGAFAGRGDRLEADSSLGSTRAPANTSVSMPSSAIAARTRSVIPRSWTWGSLTSMTRRTPSRRRWKPVSVEAPAPKTIGVDSIVKTVSFTGQPSPPPPATRRGRRAR